MIDYRKHLIGRDELIKVALAKLNVLAADSILFVTDAEDHLLGALTDGDVRRGFLRGLTFDDTVEHFVQPQPKFLRQNQYSLQEVIELRKKNFRIVPLVDAEHRVRNVINFRFLKSYLPVEAVIMAGGRGERLRPMTDEVPKPLLKVGDKPIIEHNLDRLVSFGIEDFWISVRYRGRQIEEYFGDGSHKDVQIRYIWEEDPLGTIGAVKKISAFKENYVLVTNSDLLTNIDYEDFFLDFVESNASFSVATIPYSVKIPYAVMETSNNHVLSFKEKPTYTYYSNAGIYLMKREVLDLLPDGFFNATDFMELLLAQKHVVKSYPVRNYWLDIGNPEDFAKAHADINHIQF